MKNIILMLVRTLTAFICLIALPCFAQDDAEALSYTAQGVFTQSFAALEPGLWLVGAVRGKIKIHDSSFGEYRAGQERRIQCVYRSESPPVDWLDEKEIEEWKEKFGVNKVSCEVVGQFDDGLTDVFYGWAQTKDLFFPEEIRFAGFDDEEKIKQVVCSLDFQEGELIEEKAVGFTLAFSAKGSCTTSFAN